MAAKKKRTASNAKVPKRRDNTFLLTQLFKIEYLLEILYANEFANLEPEHVGRLAESIALAKGHPLESNERFRKSVRLFLAAAIDRWKITRASLAATSDTKQ